MSKRTGELDCEIYLGRSLCPVFSLEGLTAEEAAPEEDTDPNRTGEWQRLKHKGYSRCH